MKIKGIVRNNSLKKILFVRPPFEGMDSNYIPPHMGIASLYSHCVKKFDGLFEYLFIDCLLDNIDEKETIKQILDMRPILIAFTVKSMQVEQTLNIIKSVKSVYNPIIVSGGNHVNVEPELFIEAGSDYSVTGPGERALADIIDSHLIKKEEGKELSRIIRCKNGLFPTPNWGIMDIKKYSENIHINYNNKALPVMASRGCPYQCDFCSSCLTWGIIVKYREPREVVDEIKSNIELYDISDVHFYDDNFMLDRKWLIEFLEIVESDKVKFNWICLSRPEIIYNNRDLLSRMKQNGCMGFELGFETLDADLYEKMNKKNDATAFQRAYLEICKNKFAMAEILLMLFYDGETFSTIYNTYEYIRKMKKDHRTILITSRFFATPFMGTKFAENIEDKGISISDGYKHKYAKFLNFIPYSFLESKISGYIINKKLFGLKYKMRGIESDSIIYKDEFKSIINILTVNSFCNIFNNMPINSTVYDFAEMMREKLLYEGDINALYEFTCKMLEFAIDGGAVCEKDTVLQ